MKKYIVIASSITLKGRALRKGKKISLDSKTAEKLLKLKAIEEVKKEAKAKK